MISLSYMQRIIFSFMRMLIYSLYRYNIGHIGVALGDLGLAYQAFKVSVSVDPADGEALNNIAVLEMRRSKVDLAQACRHSSCDVEPHLFEPLFNIMISVLYLS